MDSVGNLCFVTLHKMLLGVSVEFLLILRMSEHNFICDTHNVLQRTIKYQFKNALQETVKRLKSLRLTFLLYLQRAS